MRTRLRGNAAGACRVSWTVSSGDEHQRTTPAVQLVAGLLAELFVCEIFQVSALTPRETRSCFRCVTPDGTKVQNIAKYIGVGRTERTLVVERRDGTKMQVAEHGRVTMSFSFRFEVWDGNETSPQETSTTYEFDLAAGKCWTEDSESNRFELQMVRCT